MSEIKLDEFAINLPMIGVSGCGQSAPETAASCDVTSTYSLPPEVNASACDHITVYVDSCPQVNCVEGSSMISVDMVMNVLISNPITGAVSSYKLVKRLSMDKVKLAHQAELETPYQVVEAKTPEQEAQQLAEEQKMKRSEQAAKRARQLAGLE